MIPGGTYGHKSLIGRRFESEVLEWICSAGVLTFKGLTSMIWEEVFVTGGSKWESESESLTL